MSDYGFPEGQEVTNQAVFDFVLQHLRKQGRGSYTLPPMKEICLYRGPDGTACAAGCLISDELYDATMEGTGFSDVFHGEFLEPEDHPPEFLTEVVAKCHILRSRFEAVSPLVGALQTAHDARLVGVAQVFDLTVAVQAWEREMQYVAEDFDLTYTPPELEFSDRGIVLDFTGEDNAGDD